MTKAAKYMQAAFDHACERQAQRDAAEKRRFGGHYSGWTETHRGKLQIDFIEARGRTTFMPEHMRKSWKLNGKVVAASKLEKLLNE